MADDQPRLPDAETERVSMLWPKDLKAEVQTLVGKRRLTEFTVTAVRAALAQQQPAADPPPEAPAPAEVTAATPSVRQEADGPTEVGSVPSEHVLVAYEVLHPMADAIPEHEVVRMHCSCEQSFSGSGSNGVAQSRARELWDKHSDRPLTGKEIGAAAWFQDDSSFGTSGDDRLPELIKLGKVAAGMSITVTSPGGEPVAVEEPPTFVSTPQRETFYGQVPPEGMQEDGLPRIKVPSPATEEQQRRVVDIREKFGDALKPASEIDPPAEMSLREEVDGMPGTVDNGMAPTPPWEETGEVGGDPCGDLQPGDENLPLAEGVVPGDREVPAGDLRFEEAAPPAAQSSDTCETCFLPLIDGVCLSCSF